jgi:hypothetical protein
MENIYSMAKETLIWLGLDPNHGMAFRAVEKVSAFHESLETSSARPYGFSLDEF